MTKKFPSSDVHAHLLIERCVEPAAGPPTRSSLGVPLHRVSHFNRRFRIELRHAPRKKEEKKTEKRAGVVAARLRPGRFSKRPDFFRKQIAVETKNSHATRRPSISTSTIKRTDRPTRLISYNVVVLMSIGSPTSTADRHVSFD